MHTQFSKIQTIFVAFKKHFENKNYSVLSKYKLPGPKNNTRQAPNASKNRRLFLFILTMPEIAIFLSQIIKSQSLHCNYKNYKSCIMCLKSRIMYLKLQRAKHLFKFVMRVVYVSVVNKR